LRDCEERNKDEQNTKIHLRSKEFAEMVMGLEMIGPSGVFQDMHYHRLV
jgi:hypothetical protein